MKLSTRMRMKAKGIYLNIGEPLAATVNGYAKEVESLERENEKLTGQNKNLIDVLSKLICVASNLDEAMYYEFEIEGDFYEEDKVITIARNLIKEING